MEEGCRLIDHGRGTPCTQDQVMAYSRLLLLLIGVMYLVQARPSDFWCNRQARRTMEKKIEGLRTDMVACVGADTLPSPVQLPCVWLHAAEWENKTLQQKCAEVVGALRVFQDGVEGTKNRSTSECQTSLLGKLEHHIANYVAIVSRLQTQVICIDNGTVTPSRSAVQNCSSATSTSKVLRQYGTLLKRKLERLAVDLRDDVPKAEQRTTTTKGRCS